MRIVCTLWFWSLMLSVLLIPPACREISQETKSVEGVSSGKKQEEIYREKNLSEQERVKPKLAIDGTALSVLVLYKSSEGDTADKNIFAYHLQPFAMSQKHNLFYHDIDDSFPSDSMMKSIQAIVTVYNGPIMKNAKSYIEWLAGQVRKKKKVLIIGNFGAFSPDGNEWYEETVLNTFYQAIGLKFAGNWTNDPSVIQVLFKDTKMIGYEADITPDVLNHYIMVKSVHPDNTIYLALMRNDLEDSESAVVIKTPAGGLAMENYVFTQVAGQTKKLLHLERFFVECIH